MADIAQTTDRVKAQVDRILLLLERQLTLFDAIAHGSEEHRAWLKKAIEDHFAGRPVERPHG